MERRTMRAMAMEEECVVVTVAETCWHDHHAVIVVEDEERGAEMRKENEENEQNEPEDGVVEATDDRVY
jgi:hypothetical protein